MTDAPVTTGFVSANGLSFEVDQCGSGEKFALLLHGFPESKFSWRYQMPLLARLGYRVWAPNLRGYGKTSRPAGVKDYHIDRLVEDVAGLIDAAGAKETLLVAHDWGAIIAWHCAIRKVRPLSGLVIMNVPHPACFARTLKTWSQLKKSWYVFFFQLPWLPERVLGARGAEAIGRAFTEMAVDKSRFPAPVVDEYRRNAQEPGAMSAMVNYYRAAMRAGRNVMNPVPGTVDARTLMIWGEEDTALDKETTVGTEAYVRDLTLRYLPG
ncbi:MAG: alpha/beta fold hydrolase, partial [Actinomycetales bacterium]|nr:alpha/beta fold hydrolase [Actinomycetales bacterium]